MNTWLRKKVGDYFLKHEEAPLDLRPKSLILTVPNTLRSETDPAARACR